MKTTGRWYRLKVRYCEWRHQPIIYRADYCQCGQRWPCNARRNLLGGGRW